MNPRRVHRQSPLSFGHEMKEPPVLAFILVGLFAAAVLAAALMALHTPPGPDPRAQAEGFERVTTVTADGTDGKMYKIDFFWNGLKMVPGQHAIRAKIWLSETNSIDHDFGSGNRFGLRSIRVREEEGADRILFSFTVHHGGRERTEEVENTVSAAGIEGHPQAVERWWASRKVKETEPAPGHVPSKAAADGGL